MGSGACLAGGRLEEGGVVGVVPRAIPPDFRRLRRSRRPGRAREHSDKP